MLGQTLQDFLQVLLILLFVATENQDIIDVCCSVGLTPHQDTADQSLKGGGSIHQPEWHDDLFEVRTPFHWFRKAECRSLNGIPLHGDLVEPALHVHLREDCCLADLVQKVVYSRQGVRVANGDSIQIAEVYAKAPCPILLRY